MTPRVVFVQNRTHRAGAQTSLARLINDASMGRWQPVLVCSRGGWLPRECANRGIAVIEGVFPSPRSLAGRLFGNILFARYVAARLEGLEGSVAIVQSNDHQEGLFGLEIARLIGARTSIFLRSIALRREDYFKYKCNKYDLVFAVGEELRERVRKWDPYRLIELHHDAVSPDDFLPPKRVSDTAPQRVLVVGSAQELKGWADLTEALYLLESDGTLPSIQFDFTGVQPVKAENDLKLERLRTMRCSFLGHIESFRDLVRGYNLVINPSRMETFGMAAVEVVAAGVPLLSSRTGVIEQVLERPETLFPPARPDALAAKLTQTFERWNDMDFGIERAQENLRARFLIGTSAAKLDAAYRRLLAP